MKKKKKSGPPGTNGLKGPTCWADVDKGSLYGLVGQLGVPGGQVEETTPFHPRPIPVIHVEHFILIPLLTNSHNLAAVPSEER